MRYYFFLYTNYKQLLKVHLKYWHAILHTRVKYACTVLYNYFTFQKTQLEIFLRKLTRRRAILIDSNS